MRIASPFQLRHRAVSAIIPEKDWPLKVHTLYANKGLWFDTIVPLLLLRNRFCLFLFQKAETSVAVCSHLLYAHTLSFFLSIYLKPFPTVLKTVVCLQTLFYLLHPKCNLMKFSHPNLLFLFSKHQQSVGLFFPLLKKKIPVWGRNTVSLGIITRDTMISPHSLPLTQCKRNLEMFWFVISETLIRCS